MVAYNGEWRSFAAKNCKWLSNTIVMRVVYDFAVVLWIFQLCLWEEPYTSDDGNVELGLLEFSLLT